MKATKGSFQRGAAGRKPAEHPPPALGELAPANSGKTDPRNIHSTRAPDSESDSAPALHNLETPRNGIIAPPIDAARNQH